MEDQLKNMRDIYLKRYDQMIESVDTYFPDVVTCHTPDGGINFWFEIPDTCEARTFYEEAANSGVA